MVFMDPTGRGEVVLFNVTNEIESGNAKREREIAARDARYGKRLGRTNDALNGVISLVVSQSDASRRGLDTRQALGVFSRMFKEIAEAKGEHVSPTEQNLDIFLGDVGELKTQDPETYGKMIRRLREFAETGRSA